MPQAEVDTALWGGEVPWYREYVTNTRKSDPYWQQGWWSQLNHIPEHIQIPVFVIEGWYDHHLGSAMNSWAKAGLQSPQLADHRRLEPRVLSLRGGAAPGKH